MANQEHSTLTGADLHAPGAHAAQHKGDGSDPIANATTSVAGLESAADKTKLNGIESGATADMTASEILSAILTVDGSGSGLDADTIDGHDTSYFAQASHTHVAADVTSGVFNVARLATGSPDGTKFVRDDGTLAVPPGSGGSSDLEGLSDVDLTSPAIRQGLFYDGSNFVNAYFSGHYAAMVSTSSTGTVAAGTHTEKVDASAATVTRTLPTAVGIGGRRYTIIKTDSSSNVVAVGTTSSQTISGATAPWNIRYQSEAVTFESDGANWQIVSMRVLQDLTDLHDVAVSSPADGDVLTYDGSGWVNEAPSGAPAGRTLLTVASDVTNATNTYANITGLTFSVTGGTAYRFYAIILWDSQATATGADFSVNGPSGPTRLCFGFRNSQGSSAFRTSYDVAEGSTSSLGTINNLTIFEGIIIPSISGTFAMRFRSEAPGTNNTITVKAGSTLEHF